MVKEKFAGRTKDVTFVTTSENPEVCLDVKKRLAREYRHDGFDEVVTVQDVGASLYQMVSTGTVGVMPSDSLRYTSPDFDDDDEAHDHPDYEQLSKSDIVEKEQFVEQFKHNPKNYEKPAEGGIELEKPEKKAPEGAKADGDKPAA